MFESESRRAALCGPSPRAWPGTLYRSLVSGGDEPARQAAGDPLAGLGAVPNPLRSDVQARRFAHEDLARLDDLALWREGERARFALLSVEDEESLAWLKDRVKAVQREQAGRRRAT